MTVQLLLRSSLGLALGLSVLAQVRPPGGGTGGPGGTGGGGGGVGTGTPPRPGTPTMPDTTRMPGNNPNQTPDFTQRPIFISGKVMLDEGTPPPESVVIQLVCNGMPRSIGYTDSKGRFSIDLSNRNNSAVFADASQSDFGGLGGMNNPGMSSTRSGMPGQGSSGALGERSFMGCDLQASLAGFRSDSVNLGTRRVLENPEVGTIILHRLGNVEGLTISATSAMAPKDAKKAFEKGRNDAKKEKWDEAQREFQKAVEIYPKYAVAWYELGRVQEQQKDFDAARKSYAQSLAADGKYVNPYQQLAMMAAREQNWQEVAEDTDRLLRLNPVDFPQAWFYNSLANYYLKKLDVAEKSAREGISLDAAHRVPKMSHLLGVILAQRQDYSGAAEQMRNYLRFAPNATDVEMVKKQLADVEKAAGPEAKKQ